MTNDLSTQTKSTPRQLLVIQRKNEIQSLEADLKKMLPPSLPSDKFVRTVQTAITINPDLAEADKNSVLSACMKAAADGLVLDGREATLTIFNTKVKKNGQDSWEKRAQYVPMVAGIIKRVRNSGEVSRLNSFVVHENDEFEVTYGLEMKLRHKPNFDNPGKPIGSYAVCLFKDGESDFEFMPATQILNIAAQGKNADQYDPSKGKNYGEWWRKTAIRRLSKRLPVDSDIARVIQHIDEDYDFKPSGRASMPDDGQVIEGDVAEAPADKPVGKRRGAASQKLNQIPPARSPAEAPAENPIEEPEGQQIEAGEEFADVV